MTGHSTVEVAGSPVHVLDAGAGHPVLMLHGSGPGSTGAGAWAATAAALGGSHRVVAPDRAGFGSTPLPPPLALPRPTVPRPTSGVAHRIAPIRAQR